MAHHEEQPEETSTPMCFDKTIKSRLKWRMEGKCKLKKMNIETRDHSYFERIQIETSPTCKLIELVLGTQWQRCRDRSE